MADQTQYVTPEYLLSHGFRQYKSVEDGYWYQIPFSGNKDDLHFVDVNGTRNAFVVVMNLIDETTQHYDYDVYVMEDAGCGFVRLPLLWSGLPIIQFEAAYFSFMGYKPKQQ